MNPEHTLKNIWGKTLKARADRVVVLPRKPLIIGSLMIRLTLVCMLALTIYAFFSFDYKNLVLSQAFLETMENLQTMFFQPRMKHFTAMEALLQVAITLGLAFLTTLIGAFLALFLGLWAAQNLSKPWVSNTVKGLVAFIRAVPTVLWVLIFAVAAGLGSAAAVIGMSFHSVAYLVKAYSESFEEVDRDVIEALKGSGANWWQIVFQAVVPSSLSYLISWTFVRFEINFTQAVAMGAAAGAGGIGFDLYMASGHYFDLREVGTLTYAILVVAIILESGATQYKKKLDAKS